MHDFPLITTIAAAFTAAWLFGMLTARLGLSPIVGYLVAGVLIGPHTPGFVGDVDLATQLAEIGVILLMFGVGLHLHFRDLLAVWPIAVPGAIGQTLCATLVGMVTFTAFGWPLSAGLVVSVAMAVASTVVLMRVLDQAGQLDTPQGHAAIGWLIVEDIITVLILVLLPVIGHGASQSGWLTPLATAVGKLIVLVGLVVVAGSRLVPFILVQAARLRSRELFTLTVLVLSIAVAAASAAFFGASVALGAFLAGMLVAQSQVCEQAAADVLPMRDAFAVLFFVSIGMLFDPRFLIHHPGLVAAGLGIVLVVKPVAAVLIAAVMGYPTRTALTAGLGLAQIGEFSFIVSELARKHELIPEEAHHLLVACAIVSITLNPLIFGSMNRIERYLQRHPRIWSLLNGRSERGLSKTNQSARERGANSTASLAIIVGYGPVGRQVDRLLRESGTGTMIIDLNVDVVTELSAQHRPAIYGDAGQQEILVQAGLGKASHLILTMSDSSHHQGLIATARHVNPGVRIIARTRYMREMEKFHQLEQSSTIVDEVESAVALAALVLKEAGAGVRQIQKEMSKIRTELEAPPAEPSGPTGVQQAP